MRIAIDAAGRMVVPKPLRDELGITGAAELEADVADGLLEISVPYMAARVEMRDGLSVIVTDQPVAPLTVEETRAAIERVRR